MEHITHADLASRVSAGAVIRWCGTAEENVAIVELVEANKSSLYNADVERELSLVGACGTVRNGEADSPMSIVGPVPPNQDFFAILRKASVLGVNIGGCCVRGLSHEYIKVDGCTCGYDIELDLRDVERGGFPLADVPILSVALHCTCGYNMFITTLETNDCCDITCTTQSDIVTTTMKAIVTHRPLWLVGWNCYAFDNTCLNHHAPESISEVFRQVKVGSADEINYGYIINIPGVYNVDPYVYLLRNPAHSSRFEDMSLYGVAKKLGIRAKTEMPDLYTLPSLSELRSYNMNDSAIAADIWLVTDLVMEVPSLALVMCAPIYDCIRYMSGALAACSYAAEAVSKDMLIDWSRAERELRYEGGRVMDPVRGLHSDVIICDFSSMYPSIMIDGNISAESIDVETVSAREYGDVWWEDDMSRWYCQLDGVVAGFDLAKDSIVRSSLSKKISARDTVRQSKPTLSVALKVGSNSLYGGMGYRNSPIYSPACSSSVTAVGRWLLGIATKCFEECGTFPVYGDTDSVFCVATGGVTVGRDEVTARVDRGLRLLHHRLSSTPFKSLRMNVESYHPGLLLIEKKRYCKLNEDKTITYKGMCVVRRDVIGICKEACVVCCELLLKSPTLASASETISLYISQLVMRHVAGSLKFGDVSKVAKRNQRKCYIYLDSSGREQVIPVDFASSATLDYNVKYVFSAISAEILRVTVPCGLGCVSDIMLRSSPYI